MISSVFLDMEREESSGYFNDAVGLCYGHRLLDILYFSKQKYYGTHQSQWLFL